LNGIEQWLAQPRVTVRRAGIPEASGNCVVYWMQRAQRGIDNPALDVAIAAANELQRPVAVFFGLHPKYPNANLRHYAFLVEGLAETQRKIEARGAAFVFRPYPAHDLLRFCAEVKPCLVVGDENPLREPEPGSSHSGARSSRRRARPRRSPTPHAPLPSHPIAFIKPPPSPFVPAAPRRGARPGCSRHTSL
jgi:deoxyribodipyrimidine photo-lyase